MRTLFLFACSLLLAGNLHAQETYRSSGGQGDAVGSTSCPLIYLGISTGLENPNGLFGLSLEVAPVSRFSLVAGLGLSSWGTKYFGEVRGYLGECHRGWAVGAGITHNTGLKDFETELPTTNGDQEVLLDLKPATNGFLNAYRFWDLGRRMNKFYVMAGYSFRFSDDYYKIKSEDDLTSQGESVMKILAPGGLALGVGFSFNLTGRR